MHKITARKLSVVTAAFFFLMMIGMLWTSFSPQTVYAGFTVTPDQPSSPQPPTGGGGDDDDDDGGDSDNCNRGGIFGQVQDLCLGFPAAGVEVIINGNVVRTDGDGRFSLTGLTPGTYNISVNVASEWGPQSMTVNIGICDEIVTANLNYNSCLPPTPTPTSTAVFFLPETGQIENNGAAGLPLGFIVLAGAVLVLLGVSYRLRA